MTAPEAAVCCRHTLELQELSRATHCRGESWNHFSWKRPPRSLSPAVNPALPRKSLQTWFPFSQMGRIRKPSFLGTDTSCISSAPGGICLHFFFPCFRFYSSHSYLAPARIKFLLAMLCEAESLWEKAMLACSTACLVKGSSGSAGSLQPITPFNSSPILTLTMK